MDRALRAVVLALLALVASQPAALAIETPLTRETLDDAAFEQWADGTTLPVAGPRDGPGWIAWTRTTQPGWSGVEYGASKQPGPRHLRLALREPLAVGTVLVRGGGRVSVLRPEAPYPGALADEGIWLPAERIGAGAVTAEETGHEDYALWVLPPGTVTRAVRFSHTAAPADRGYGGWLGGVCVLTERLANLGPRATVFASATGEKAGLLVNESNDGTWGAWDNGPEGAAAPVTPEHAEWIVLAWPEPVSLSGLACLWTGFGSAEAQVYVGPADRHPREAAEADWRTAAAAEGFSSQYPRALGPNWLDFGEVITTRAVRLRISGVTAEDHPHLTGNTREGKRVWLGELLALSPLGDAGLGDAIGASAPDARAGHPPIPVRFTLPEAGYVTLVIEDAAGKRVRNLVSETWFAAGENVAWWDGTDDLGRDRDAARHGVYQIPCQFVAPGDYTVRGLVRGEVDLRYEFSIYNAGTPAWEIQDTTGAWLANHTPPSSALYVPGDRAPGGKPLVYLGSYVSEGGHGLAWVDLDGRKQGGRGWVGGNWTGAPYLAFDAGPGHDPATYLYVGSAWEGELRLTAITEGGDQQVVRYSFEGGKEAAVLTGIAARDGLLVCSLPKQGRLLFVDAPGHALRGTADLPDPRGLAFDAEGRLLALSGTRLLRFEPPPATGPITLSEPTVLSEGFEDPQAIALDAGGRIYVSDRGTSHQVKVLSPDGQPLRTVGRPGAPSVGPYDPLHMNNPSGLTIDEREQLWVAETDFQPKRVSVWSLEGELLRAFYGPSQYGGGGTLDPRERTRFTYGGMEFRLDWDRGTDQPVSVLYRPGAGGFRPPDGYGTDGMPETPIYVGERRYLTNAYTSNPTNGTSVAVVWLVRDDVAHPCAAFGRASEWSLLKGPEYRDRWPEGTDPGGSNDAQAVFVWSDTDGDALVQPAEVTMRAAEVSGVTVMPDLSVVAAREGTRAVRYAPTGFAAGGAPRYDLTRGETLVEGAQGPASSGGDQALVGDDGWTVLTVAPKPFAPESLGGVLHGEPRWQYPSLWPGLHASHEAPAPDRPGELIGTTRLLGGLVRPQGTDIGQVFAINGNMGNIYLLTTDGLFVATLFRDIRQGEVWSMPIAERGMSLNAVSLHDESFWPSITQTADGRIYLVDGGRTSLVRVDGLASARRLPAGALAVSEGDLEAARAWFLEMEALRQRAEGRGSLSVAVRRVAPVVDGKLDDWAAAEWTPIDKRGVAAYFDSNSKPYDVAAALSVAGGRLYAAFRTGDPGLLRNTGEVANAPFKTGGALDLMLGCDPLADPGRVDPVPGDERLLVTQVGGRVLALLYRAVVPGTTDPVPFSSPWRTITLDRVEDVSADVELAAQEGSYEFSIPLARLGLSAAPGTEVRGDVGILRGNGFQTLQRVYWSNKATAIVSDVPSEAMLTPSLWGRIVFERGP